MKVKTKKAQDDENKKKKDALRKDEPKKNKIEKLSKKTSRKKTK